ncbi:MAG: class I adenylate-forming enzyme family protein [Acidimicrobiales bacterium]|nr:class I adenylate-forming enzyme family protein [Acidimicrobiales bacterium]
MTIDHLTYHAERIGDQIAVIDDRPGFPIRKVNYHDFNAMVNRLTNGLLNLGLQSGSHIAWWGNNSLEILTAIHAIRKSGGMSIPIPYKSTSEEASYLLSNADVEILIIDSAYIPVVSKIRRNLPTLKHVITYGNEDEIPFVLSWETVLGNSETPKNEGEAEAALTMIYTSGTTGKPKGAMRRVGGEINQYGALLEFIGWDKMDDLTFLTTGPLYHSGPSGFARRAQLVGGTVVCQYAFDSEDWLRLVETYDVSATFSAPTPIRRITSLPPEIKDKYDVSSMKSMIANAAPWTMALKKAYLRDFPKDSLWEVYGSTELSVCTILAPEDQLRKPGSCGLPSPGVEIRLLDESGGVIDKPDIPGELYARSKALFNTYYKSHDKYLDDHIDGFQTVGDIAYQDSDGYFYICDRKNDMIITGGVNVYPAEIENVLDDHPAVHEVAVLASPDEEWGEAVSAVVVLNQECTAIELIDFARQRLSGPKTPKQIIFVNELPKTGSGKVLKRELSHLFNSAPQSNSGIPTG